MRVHMLMVFALFSMAMAQDGLYKINEDVTMDPMFRHYPDAELPAVRNALFLADIIKTVFSFNGFGVYNQIDERVGILPNYYIGFPKTGSTFTYNWLQERLPCAIKQAHNHPLRKELNVVRNIISRFNCSLGEDMRFLNSCDQKSIEYAILEGLGVFEDGASELLSSYYIENLNGVKESIFCADIDFIDGAPTVMYDSRVHIQDDIGYRREIFFDFLVFIQSLTPQAKFIALNRDNTVESLQSHYFYFKGKDSTQAEYRDSLISTVEQLEVLEEKNSKCHTLFVGKLSRPHLSSYPSSCTLQRVIALFGENALFVTDVNSLEMCEDNILEWLSQSTKVLKNHQCGDIKHHDPKNWDMNFERTPIIVSLEERFVQLIETTTYPPVEKDLEFFEKDLE